MNCVRKSDERWLTLSKPNGSTTWMESLRPAEWVARHVSDEGALQLSIPELELKGTAEVHSIEAYPEISLGDSSVVTSRYITYGNSQLTTITLSTGETITGTPIHPIWSGTRRDWVPLGELEEEEELLGMYGPVTVMSVQSQTDSQPVYNLEIHGQHVYQISKDGVLVHNADLAGCSIADKIAQKMFAKHGEDFGLTGSWNPKRAAELRQAVNNHLLSPQTIPVSGTYRGQRVVHHLDENTGLNVILDENGGFISGWKLNPEQLASVKGIGRLF